MKNRQDPPAAESLARFRARVRFWVLVALSTAHCPLATSCKPNKRYDLIEAELRTRERELTDTRAALEQSRNLNRAYAQQSQSSPGPQVPATAPVYVPVKDITLARGTGGVDEDGVPGDEGLMVVVVPRDEDGAAVKVPARVQVAAWEVTAAGIKNPIGTWDVPAEKVRPTWRAGFISTGYFVAVPWQTYPATERVRVAVRLTTLDGRAFEADKDLFVRPCVPPNAAPAAPTGTPAPVPPATPVPALPRPPREPLYPDPVPPGAEELPPPMRTSQRGSVLLPPVSE
ncbi:Uncharacterized protein OS=Planctomyces maris DSM 8797 GN=PM8797T_13545 PE=4 SV=1 [Gemmataceae bacterium]|nr:Uncharacterized protein OS=Planctomyces maris DSM 8797 GN=PM8797T_13545 PE=4 SV=1 [Gemmataceae bacterium]VTU00161.1 Uncharacterized protein OS=Planctomyces maris DSM 8797 GN=PM8797T_13545 PE=4 SV=1 [Gemmataceae bacterium]